MNAIILTGRITKDLILEQTQSGMAKCNFGLAVNKAKNEVDFFNCGAFGKNAETIVQYAKKGQMISIAGQINSSVVDKNGVKTTYWNVMVNQVSLIGDTVKQDQETKTQVVEEDDLPF